MPLQPSSAKPPFKSAALKSASIKPPAALASPHPREGDANWMRVMHTKETQWRFMNALALHEVNAMETAACSELDQLCARLDELITKAAEMETLVRQCKAQRAAEMLMRVTAPSTQRLVSRLEASKRYGYVDICSILRDSKHAVPVRDAAALRREMHAFRKSARTFTKVASECGLQDVLGLADMLQRLADVMGSEVGEVSRAAHAVSHAGQDAERRRADIVDEFVHAEDTPVSLDF